MIVTPKIRGFICTTAHPAGCAQNVASQITFVKKNLPQNPVKSPKKVLIIGASTGYGLASRIAAAFGFGAQTIGIFFDRPSEGTRTATAGWYNTAAFEKAAHSQGLYAKSLNGDAFSKELKQQAIELIQKDWHGGVDLVIYSLASPRRVDPATGEVYNSVLKTMGEPFIDKNVDVFTGNVNEARIESANASEAEHTVKVMGGEDWALWIEALMEANCLEQGVKTVAYSYIGPKMTYPIYYQGTIGAAKAHLEKTAHALQDKLNSLGGQALISVNKALVTQASSAIPVVPLYISILYKVMKEKNLHEGCIEQMQRLFTEHLYGAHPLPQKELIRIDDWEMRPDVQDAVSDLWNKIDSSNIMALSDLAGYRHEFQCLFGFDIEGVNYEADVDIAVGIPSIPS